jgi:hypothetical protein
VELTTAELVSVTLHRVFIQNAPPVVSPPELVKTMLVMEDATNAALDDNIK